MQLTDKYTKTWLLELKNERLNPGNRLTSELRIERASVVINPFIDVATPRGFIKSLDLCGETKTKRYAKDHTFFMVQ